MFDGFELHKELQSLVVQLIKDAFFLTEKKKKKAIGSTGDFPYQLVLNTLVLSSLGIIRLL